MTLDIKDDEDLLICLVGLPDSEPEQQSKLNHQVSYPAVTNELEDKISAAIDLLQNLSFSEDDDSVSSSFSDKNVQTESSNSEQSNLAKSSNTTDYYPKKNVKLDKSKNDKVDMLTDLDIEKEQDSGKPKELEVLENSAEINLPRSPKSGKSELPKDDTKDGKLVGKGTHGLDPVQTKFKTADSSTHYSSEGVQPGENNEDVSATQKDFSIGRKPERSTFTPEANAVEADFNDQVSLLQQKTSEVMPYETRHDTVNSVNDNDQVQANTNVKNGLEENENAIKEDSNKDLSGSNRPSDDVKLYVNSTQNISDQEIEVINSVVLEDTDSVMFDPAEITDQESGVIKADTDGSMLDSAKIIDQEAKKNKADILEDTECNKLDPATINDQDTEVVTADKLEETNGHMQDLAKINDQETEVVKADILEDTNGQMQDSAKINDQKTEVVKADILEDTNGHNHDSAKINDQDTKLFNVDILEETGVSKHDQAETEVVNANLLEETEGNNLVSAEINDQETEVNKTDNLEGTDGNKLAPMEFNDNFLLNPVQYTTNLDILPNQNANVDEIDSKLLDVPNQTRWDAQTIGEVHTTEKGETDEGKSMTAPHNTTSLATQSRALKWLKNIAGPVLVGGGLMSAYPIMRNYWSAQAETVKVLESISSPWILPLLAIAPAVVLGQMFNHLVHNQKPFDNQQKMLALLAFVHLVGMAIWCLAT